MRRAALGPPARAVRTRPRRPRPSRILIDEIERPRSGPMRGHRRHHPARPGRDRARRGGADGLRAGRARHREDRGRAAPGRVPAVRAPGAGPRGAAWSWSGRTRPFSPTSATCCPRSASSTSPRPPSDDLVASVPVRGSDDEVAAIVKGDARMAEVLRRARGLGPHPVGRGGRAARRRGAGGWPPGSSRSSCDELRHRDVRYGAARELLAHRIAHVILTRMEAAGEAPATTAPTRRCGGPGRCAPRSTRSGRRWTRSAGVRPAVRRRTSWPGRPRAC